MIPDICFLKLSIQEFGVKTNAHPLQGARGRGDHCGKGYFFTALT